ncbi:MAG: FAD-dependent monooxygenase [Cyclobacteriaceae bacterium]|nr:FAD-dependent monooxygenase [Cyclobacteriaceae bacterium]
MNFATSTNEKGENRKAIIIGCGIAGPAMALALQRKGISSVIYESRKSFNDAEGLFLGVSPNGLNVLKEFILIENILTDYCPGRIVFYNSKNKRIGELDNRYQTERYGAELVQVRRSLINSSIRNAAMAKGIEIHTGKKLSSTNQTKNNVTAYFEDGSSATADFLIGCDGIHSAVRKSFLGNTPRITYTGLLSTGGFSTIDNTKGMEDGIHMIFGERGFFAYAVSNRGEIWWFNNIARKQEPERNELTGIEKANLQKTLIDLHRNDRPIIRKIIEASKTIEIYPIYDIPSLKTWYSGRICLIGDAAHATAPHIGQGASLALEDTLVLANFLHKYYDVSNAFHQFQELRQSRVEKIVQQARKVGDTKTAPNKFQQFFRDLLLPIFLKSEAKKMDWVYSYKVSTD